jgi:SAM-dependent methyltransferase
MKSLIVEQVLRGARRGRSVLRLATEALDRRLRKRLPGRFQPYSHTLPDRYPWLFQFAARALPPTDLNILSFGCSRGDEVFTLRHYFPLAALRGIDVDPRNIAACTARAAQVARMSFCAAATTHGEPSNSFDAIFCLAVLCLGDLTIRNAERCDPYLRFADFDDLISDFARCLKPGGLLFLHTSNFRFGDTSVARDFDVVLEASPSQLAPDVVFDRSNRLLPGVQYLPVGFRKHRQAASSSL